MAVARKKLTEKQLSKILRESSLISARQLERASAKQQRTGYPLRQILLPQIPWGRIRRMLENEVTLPDGSPARVGDVLADAGWITRAQLEEARREEEETGRAVGQILLEQGVVSQEQLREAIRYHKRTGVSLWRSFINLDLAFPKQVSDALHTYNRFPFIYRADDEFSHLLVKEKLLSSEEVGRFLTEREERGISLVRLIAESDAVHPPELTAVVARLFALPIVDIASETLDPEALSVVPPEVIARLQILPFAREEKEVHVAMADPTVLPALQRMGTLVDLQFKAHVAGAGEIRRIIEEKLSRMRPQAEWTTAPCCSRHRPT